MTPASDLTLTGKIVLVTRPETQAENLCRLLESNGGTAISFPVIKIVDPDDRGDISTEQDPAGKFDYCIFTSRNAVTKAFTSLFVSPDLLNQSTIIAIGMGTADELKHFGIKNILHAGTGADSESLLELPELQSEQIDNRIVLIVKGEGGRNLLVNELQNRGATIRTANVYKRIMPEYDAAYICNIWKNDPDIIIVTSNEGLNNLVNLTHKDIQKKLFNTALLVISQRTADLAVQLGFSNRIIVASEKSDEGFLQALLEFRKEN